MSVDKDIAKVGEICNECCRAGCPGNSHCEKTKHLIIDPNIVEDIQWEEVPSTRDYNVGASDYASHKVQPWDIWKEYSLNPWDADIVKRVLRNKEGEERSLDYEKIKHICDERLRQIREEASID